MASLAREVVADLQGPITESGATITVGPLPVIRGTAPHLRQALQNLIGNALKFQDGITAPVVAVDATRSADEWSIRVQDNGIGMDPKYAKRIFLPFQRLHSREAFTGSGIGLAIVNRVVEQHGGSIHVDSAPGTGATFTLTLPVDPTTSS